MVYRQFSDIIFILRLTHKHSLREGLWWGCSYYTVIGLVDCMSVRLFMHGHFRSGELFQIVSPAVCEEL